MENLDRFDLEMINAFTLAVSARTRRIRKEKNLNAIAPAEIVDSLIEDIIFVAEGNSYEDDLKNTTIDGKKLRPNEVEIAGKLFHENYGDFISITKSYLKSDDKHVYIKNLLDIYMSEKDKL